MEDYAALANRLDPALWTESQEFAEGMKTYAEEKFKALNLDLGEGGGNYALLYFVTRRLPAETVVETGVAAGFSSKAVLEALKANGGENCIRAIFRCFVTKTPNAGSAFWWTMS